MAPSIQLSFVPSLAPSPVEDASSLILPDLVEGGGDNGNSGNGNIGNSFTVTRIGESLLVSVGFNIDESKDNTGVNCAVQLGQFLGPAIPPAGLYGLE